MTHDHAEAVSYADFALEALRGGKFLQADVFLGMALHHTKEARKAEAAEQPMLEAAE